MGRLMTYRSVRDATAVGWVVPVLSCGREQEARRERGRRERESRSAGVALVQFTWDTISAVCQSYRGRSILSSYSTVLSPFPSVSIRPLAPSGVSCSALSLLHVTRQTTGELL